eukprot:2287200-Amphidinium_carterae.4
MAEEEQSDVARGERAAEEESQRTISRDECEAEQMEVDDDEYSNQSEQELQRTCTRSKTPVRAQRARKGGKEEHQQGPSSSKPSDSGKAFTKAWMPLQAAILESTLGEFKEATRSFYVVVNPVECTDVDRKFATYAQSELWLIHARVNKYTRGNPEETVARFQAVLDRARQRCGCHTRRRH